MISFTNWRFTSSITALVTEWLSNELMALFFLFNAKLRSVPISVKRTSYLTRQPKTGYAQS
jgi:hypothetical protein